jgi:hypothetical protein
MSNGMGNGPPPWANLIAKRERMRAAALLLQHILACAALRVL